MKCKQIHILWFDVRNSSLNFKSSIYKTGLSLDKTDQNTPVIKITEGNDIINDIINFDL